MAGFLTVCFSDWNADKFRRGKFEMKTARIYREVALDEQRI